MRELENKLVIVRGGGDLATGVIHKLSRCGFLVLALECPRPSAIRRHVAFSEAVYEGVQTVEGMTCLLASGASEALSMVAPHKPVMLVDPEAEILKQVKPWALVDAVLAKRNLGTNRRMADRTIALGPGFTAGEDVDLVIETKRGHQLGRIIESGEAAANTGIPGIICGYGKERVIHAPAEGILHCVRSIADVVEEGELLAFIRTKEGEDVPVAATLTGILRGILRDGYPVTKGFKTADIDPRQSERVNCDTISDKARCLAGAVLEAILR
ncbi:MAG: EF2563 family selenium-dependent molybdenum hydroxylase system protein [Clostridiales bacterium]|nr:EF2563 family selenium-dependent molybdenum hydroxylase system protein [Clostridiales bacterium]